MDTEHSRTYTRYLHSAAWFAKRRAVLKERGRRCQGCGTTTRTLEVHHLTYEHLGHERDGDLQVLCHPCHEQADRERARRQEQEHWRRRVYAWASRVHGEYWDETIPWEVVEGQFTRWLEQKGYA